MATLLELSFPNASGENSSKFFMGFVVALFIHNCRHFKGLLVGYVTCTISVTVMATKVFQSLRHQFAKGSTRNYAHAGSHEEHVATGK